MLNNITFIDINKVNMSCFLNNDAAFDHSYTYKIATYCCNPTVQLRNCSRLLARNVWCFPLREKIANSSRSSDTVVTRSTSTRSARDSKIERVFVSRRGGRAFSGLPIDLVSPFREWYLNCRLSTRAARGCHVRPESLKRRPSRRITAPCIRTPVLSTALGELRLER